ncbi:MAG: AEC family transporter [Lachnospiraceae bacterium]|nr:AEC family transporter [Lachnospiraceae bacterium]
MEIVLLLLKQSLIMFVYLLIGYFLYKRKLVSKQGSADMGRMLLYVIMPVAIVKSYIREFSLELLEGLVISFVLALLALVLSVVVSRVLFGKEEGVERFGAAFSNAGFIGIPLVQMALGAEAVFYVASFVAILNILQWTYGILVMTGDRSAISFRKIRTNPIVLSFLAGLLLFFLPVTLPDALTDIIATLASMNGPVEMIVLGVYLAQIPLKSLFTDRLVYKCTAVRLILIPALTILLLVVIPADETIKLTVLIAASAPVGSNVAIFAQLYDQDYTRAVKEVCLSTLLCILTLPLIVGVANLVF